MKRPFSVSSKSTLRSSIINQESVTPFDFNDHVESESADDARQISDFIRAKIQLLKNCSVLSYYYQLFGQGGRKSAEKKSSCSFRHCTDLE